MRAFKTVESVEALIGTPAPPVLLKAVSVLDQGCREVLAAAPIAGFGFVDHDGTAHSTFVGGVPGFASPRSLTSLSFRTPLTAPIPAPGSDASMLFFLPGVGETLRLRGKITNVADDRITINLQETWVHCARAILRSGLWDAAFAETGHASEERADPRPAEEWLPQATGPLDRPEIATFLSRSPFLIVSSGSRDGHADTSPKGDPPGFVQILDSHTLAIPDRRGNKRADTFHNLVTCDAVSIAALIPGWHEVLHLSGTAHVSDDPPLLAEMTIKTNPPLAALVVRVHSADIRSNESLREAALWVPTARADYPPVPDLARIAAAHLASNTARGAAASMTRVLSKGMARLPRVTRRVIDAGYRRELRDEGYELHERSPST